MSQYDSLIIGEIARDTNVDYDGTVVQAIGGAVYYSGFAAANMGHKIAVLPKADTREVDLKAAFAAAPNITVYPLHSDTSFVTKNVYHTADRERRTSTVDSLIAPYTTDEVPVDQIDAAIWHLAGLAGGDIPNEMIPFAAKHAMVAIDVQTMLRWVENGGMVYHDWTEKKDYSPYCTDVPVPGNGHKAVHAPPNVLYHRLILLLQQHLSQYIQHLSIVLYPFLYLHKSVSYTHLTLPTT